MNNTSYGPEGNTKLEDEIIIWLSKIEPYFIIGIFIIGFLGNLCSFIIFGFTYMRNKASSCILAGLSFSDNGFLIFLLIANLHHFNVNAYMETSFVCKLTTYFSSIFAFSSVWYVTLLTIERFIMLYFNTFYRKVNSNKLNIVILTCLIVFAAVYNSFLLVTTDIEKENGCTTLDHYYDFVHKISLFDILLTLAIPMVIIFVMNISIIVKLAKYNKTNNDSYSENMSSVLMNSILYKSKHNRNTIQVIMSSTKASETVKLGPYSKYIFYSKHNDTIEFHKSSEKFKRRKYFSVTSKLLLFISTLFLLLHIPIAIVKLRYSVTGFIYGSIENIEITKVEEILERLTHYFYYLNFVTNFFFYSCCSSNFRLQFRRLLTLFKAFKFKIVFVRK